MDELATTDVSSGTPSAGAPDSGAAVASGGEGISSSGAVPGATTDQVGTVAQQQEGSAAPASDVPDYLQGVPTVEELQGRENQPYAKALLQLRPAHETLRASHRELESRFEPWKGVVEKYGEPARAQSLLEIADGLFAPVVNEKGETQYHPETRLPLTTTMPALERLQAESPDTVAQLVADSLKLQFGGDSVLNHIIRDLGLDPQKIEQYRQWETSGAPVADATGAVSSEELAEIPPQFHEAYKSLTASARDQLLYMDPLGRDQILRDRQHFMASERFQAEQRQQATQQAQAALQQSQVEYVSQVRSDAYSSLKNELASKWTPSADSAVNEVQYGLVMSVLANVIDPAARSVSEGLLNAIGVPLDPAIDSLVNTIEQKANECKQYEAQKNKIFADRARSAVDTATLQLKAKLNGIAKGITAALDGRNREARETVEAGLNGALSARPVLGGAQAVTGPGAGRISLPNPNDPMAPENFLRLAGRG